jgi:hypothetical protein
VKNDKRPHAPICRAATATLRRTLWSKDPLRSRRQALAYAIPRPMKKGRPGSAAQFPINNTLCRGACEMRHSTSSMKLNWRAAGGPCRRCASCPMPSMPACGAFSGWTAACPTWSTCPARRMPRRASQ